MGTLWLLQLAHRVLERGHIARNTTDWLCPVRPGVTGGLPFPRARQYSGPL